MAKANGYMNGYNLSFESSKTDLNDFYHQQDQGTFDYIPTSHSLIQDMGSLMYTQQQQQQQHGPNDTILTGMMTATPRLTYLDQNEHGVYTTPNSDKVGSCTRSAQNTLPIMTGSSSSSTMGTDTTTTVIMTTSNSDTTTSSSSPTPSNWTPSASPLSTSSTSLTCMNGPLLLPVSSATDPSFLSSFSPSLSIGTNVDTINYISNNNQHHQQSLDGHHTKSLDYPSPMPTFYHHQQQQQQQHSVSTNTLSPTFMPTSQRSSLTSATSPRTTASPTMTTSASAPTAMVSSNDSQASPSELQHAMDFKLSPQPIHENENDQDTLPMDHSQTQSNMSTTANTELRRQIHIQSEQKRRAQIKDGFEDLRNELPSCLNKKMSKVALLQRTVQHIQHLKSTQITILGELERLVNENEHLKKFQENVSQYPGLMKSYHNPNNSM